MLGTGRRRVSLAAADLQNAGLIENMRGTIRVLNRKSLEEAACECYGVIQHFNGGLGLKYPSPNSFPCSRDGACPVSSGERLPSRGKPRLYANSDSASLLHVTDFEVVKII